MRITDLLKKQGIALGASPSSKSEAIDLLVGLHEKCGNLKDTAAYKEGIIDRVFTTNLTYTSPDILSREWHVSVNMCKYVAYIIDTLNHDDSLSDLLNPVKKIHAIVDKHKQEHDAQVTMEFDK